MNKMIKINYLLITFGCFLSGIYTQDNLSCRQIDFNRTDSILDFETCVLGNEFTIKSYSDELLDPYRNDSANYLTGLSGWSCFSTIKSFTLDQYSEFHLALYLQSAFADDQSFLQIQVIDVGVGSIFRILNEGVTNKWNEYDIKFDRPVENAKVSIK